MTTFYKSGILALLLTGLTLTESIAQDMLFSLEECISYALENSTTIGRASNQIESASYLEKIKTIERYRILFGKERIPVSKQYKEAFDEYIKRKFL